MNDPMEPPEQDDDFHVLVRPVLLADERALNEQVLAGVGDAWCKAAVSEAVTSMSPGDVIEIVVRRGYV